MNIKVLNRDEMLAVRLGSAAYAAKHITAEEAHRKFRENGSAPSPNPFYTGLKTEKECYKLLNAV